MKVYRHRCGGILRPTGLHGLLECDGPNCVDNPRSKEASADRHATVEAWGRDIDEDEDADADD